MKITDVKTESYIYNVEDVFGSAARWTTQRNVVLVFVETDEGIIGIGEADSVGSHPRVIATLIDELKPIIVGRDPFHVEEIWAMLYRQTMFYGRRGMAVAAISGIDVALWDLMGKTAKQPVYKLLGGARDKVMVYASQGFYRPGKDVAHYAEEAVRAKKAGFKAVKLKIGKLSIREDMERVAAVREAVGPDIRVMVDGNFAYSVKEAIQVAKNLERYDVYFFEEPVWADDIAGSAQVAASTSVSIAGYETEFTKYGFRELIDARAVDFVQPSLVRSGGFTECKKIAAYAEAHRIPCVAHSFTSGWALLANLHFLASINNGDMVEYDQNPYPLRQEIIDQQILELDSDGLISLPDKPGLGADICFDKIEKYRV